jgi:hypothetical protein
MSSARGLVLVEMRTRFTASVLVIIASAGFLRSQDRAPENVRIVATGEIRKVDQKNKTIQFKITLDKEQFGGFNRPGGAPGGQRPGGRGGGGGRRGGGPIGGRGPTRPSNAGQPDSIEVKVFVTPNTVIRGDHEVFNFSNLKTGQHVSLTGVHKGTGNDIEALEIQQ